MKNIILVFAVFIISIPIMARDTLHLPTDFNKKAMSGSYECDWSGNKLIFELEIEDELMKITTFRGENIGTIRSGRVLSSVEFNDGVANRVNFSFTHRGYRLSFVRDVNSEWGLSSIPKCKKL